MNNRRKLLVALGASAVAVPFGSSAQQPAARMHRIGFLGPTSAAGIASRLKAFRVGLRELGYVEGKNLVIEFRWAEGKYDRLPELAAELVRLNVDLIVTAGTPGVRAAKQATTTIPIVMASSGDPVASGLVTSLARPGGNITGSTYFGPELNAKRVELLKEAVPRVTQVAYLRNFDNSGLTGPSLRAVEITAKSLKIGLQPFLVRGPNDFSSTFAAMAKKRVDAVVINEDSMLMANVSAIVDLAIKRRLPSAGDSAFAEAGGLMGYGVDQPEIYRRAAYFIDRILKGTKPGDLPIERATRFELTIHLKTAKAIGIKIPPTLVQRADKVIE